MQALSFADDWTAGIASNLLAELVGFIFGTLVTLFGVNRLLEYREQKRLAPLRKRFATAVESCLYPVALEWGVLVDLISSEQPAEQSKEALIDRVFEHL